MMKKIILYSIVIFVTYMGLEVYATYANAEIVVSCGDLDEVKRIQQLGTRRDKLAHSTKFWTCVKDKQNFIQKIFFKVPEIYLSPNE